MSITVEALDYLRLLFAEGYFPKAKAASALAQDYHVYRLGNHDYQTSKILLDQLITHECLKIDRAPLSEKHDVRDWATSIWDYYALLPQGQELCTAYLKEFIGALPDGDTVTIHDGSYPSPSDPGGYVTILSHNHELFAMVGNHGWSSNWVPVQPDGALKYLLYCYGLNAHPNYDIIPIKRETPPVKIRLTDIDRAKTTRFARHLQTAIDSER